MTPLKFLIIICSLALVSIIAVAIYVSDTISYGMPSLEQLENPPQNFATQIISSDGKVLDHFFIQRRVSLPIDSIPVDFINALIAVEDRKFYDHWGIHFGRILKAAVKNIFAGRTKEGASTITMQLATNLFFTKTTTLDRKIKEAVAAIEIEKNYTKNEILEMYSNTVNFGRGAYGLYVASQVYFDKSPKELTLAECAHLVAMLKAPERYNGIKNYEAAINRRNLVLKLMEDAGFITSGKRFEATNEPINITKTKVKNTRSWVAPHFVEMIRQEITKTNLLEDHDIYRDGLIIYTTLNSKIQKYAEEALEEHLSSFQKVFNKSWNWKNNQKLLEELILKAAKTHPEYLLASDDKKNSVLNRLKKDRQLIDSVKNIATTVQAGFIVIDPSTGAILAMVGASPKFMLENPDSKYSLNHVTQIKRQPGSAFKPFVYATALSEGLDPSSRIECGPFSYRLPSGETWSPRGTGSCGEGETKTLYQAMVSSINTVAARLITQVTAPINVIQLEIGRASCRERV